MQLAFGSGALWGNRTDVTGSGIGPDQFGVLQDVTIDWEYQSKRLYGTYQFPVDIARGEGKITGKAKFARIYGAVYGDLFFGQTPAVGQLTVANNELDTVGSSPYTFTVSNASSYVDDLGLNYVTSGNRFTRVTSPSAAGQYSVNTGTGVYTFSASDSGVGVNVSYLYNNTTTGKKVALSNQLLGYTPTFKATFFNTKTTQGVAANLVLVLNACVSSKFSLPTKLDDYQINEFDFEAFADASNNIGTLSTNE